MNKWRPLLGLFSGRHPDTQGTYTDSEEAVIQMLAQIDEYRVISLRQLEEVDTWLLEEDSIINHYLSKFIGNLPYAVQDFEEIFPILAEFEFQFDEGELCEEDVRGNYIVNLLREVFCHRWVYVAMEEIYQHQQGKVVYTRQMLIDDFLNRLEWHIDKVNE